MIRKAAFHELVKHHLPVVAALALASAVTGETLIWLFGPRSAAPAAPQRAASALLTEDPGKNTGIQRHSAVE